MENLTHTLAGAVMGRAGLGRMTPLATPALLISANLPDADIAGVLFGRNYLDFHRGITHSVVAAPMLALALTACLWLYGRARREPDARPHFFALFVASLLGTVSHPLLDLLNDYGLRPWLPLNEIRFYGDMVSIVDPWMWIIFGGALCLTASSRGRRLAWAALGFVLITLITLLAGAALGAVWLAVLALLLVAGRSLRLSSTSAARAALLLFFLYLGGVAVLRESVAKSARAAVPGFLSGPIRQVEVLPGRAGGPHRWTVVVETEHQYLLASVGLREQDLRSSAFESYEKNLTDSRYREALSQPELAAMARFARFPSVEVQESRGGCVVFLRDLRYARVSTPGWGVARADLPRVLCSARTAP